VRMKVGGIAVYKGEEGGGKNVKGTFFFHPFVR
jgi:hypothetical protein